MESTLASASGNSADFAESLKECENSKNDLESEIKTLKNLVSELEKFKTQAIEDEKNLKSELEKLESSQ